ncbi:DUF1796 family putative cysteine peptidase [Streptococcus parauberis]|uniref:Papain-like cysteine peptidase n=1 Tax=Streptococcus parauberis TaxID=1348 RepID=A0A0E2USW2_9STRE|nr:DUF1796 family putative cysteine peptidase [Streptococcus parauberis]UWM91921.1 papain-like cysteine peptidase [Streptococcus parauberis]BAU04024.1 hypothetical protein [Streptococcus parauberis]BAU04079.1 hypothetical protein [Streptococcus parauberis]GAJ62101.1 hypothetical protein SS13_contig00014-0045 [Streptococcus parauberis]
MENLKKSQFKHFISLGYFCSIAQDLEKLGLRDKSYPFDWCITDLEKNIELINNNFESILDMDLLSQDKEIPHHYRNDKYDFYFFHDFNSEETLKDQLQNVKDKYKRRIKGFYKDIEEPTLFIRYISPEKINSEGKPLELIYIEENHSHILDTLKRFNPKNEIIYITNIGFQSEVIKVFNVSNDDGDIVSRSPLYKQNSLFNYFSNVDYPNREQNLDFLKSKDTKTRKLRSRIIKKIRDNFGKKYTHVKQFND